jgi:hypothetical protein
MLQVTTKVAPMDLVGECGRNDADRQRHHDQAGDNRCSGDQLSQVGDRDHVAVADGAQRPDGPPHRTRDGAEFVGLRLALDQMHGGRRDQRRAEQDDEAAVQGPPLGIKRGEQRAHSRRVADELEKAHVRALMDRQPRIAERIREVARRRTERRPASEIGDILTEELEELPETGEHGAHRS